MANITNLVLETHATMYARATPLVGVLLEYCNVAFSETSRNGIK